MEKIKTWIISEAEIDKNCGEICARVAGGAIMVYPTDTVYGIGTTITKPDDIRRIFTIKGRTLRKPMALLIGNKFSMTSRRMILLIEKKK